MRRLTVILLLFGSAAQTQTPKWSATVATSFSIKDSELKEQVTSFITRELRTLGDIRIVTDNDDPEYVIRIFGYPLENKPNVTTGYTFSFVILQPLQSSTVTFIVKSKLSQSDFRGISAI